MTYIALRLRSCPVQQSALTLPVFARRKLEVRDMTRVEHATRKPLLEAVVELTVPSLGEGDTFRCGTCGKHDLNRYVAAEDMGDNEMKCQQRRLEVIETTMLRWMCKVTKKDKIRNEHVRGSVKWHGWQRRSRRKI